MSRQILHQPIDVSESKKTFQKRGGELCPNHSHSRIESNGDKYKPVTTNSARHQPKYRETRDSRLLNDTPVGVGRVTRVGGNRIRPNDTAQYVQKLIDNLQDHELIVERYPTHYCHGTSSKTGETCGFDTFVRSDQKAEQACMACGNVTALVTYLSTNSMNEEGKVDQNARNHAPANTLLGSNTSGPQVNGQVPSHKTRFNRINSMIKNVLSSLSDVTVMNRITNRASVILQQLYDNKHPPTSYETDDNVNKMPQGEAATAAACFYAAKIEHEHVHNTKTPITMENIIDCANQEFNKGHKVSVERVMYICDEFLIKGGCVRQNIRPVLQNGLHRNTIVHRARLKNLQQCGRPIKIILIKKKDAGFEIKETTNGLLEVTEVCPEEQAYRKGLRPGDYLVAFEDHEIPVECTSDMFTEWFHSSLANNSSHHTLSVRRRVRATKSTVMPKLGVRRNIKKRKQTSASASYSIKRSVKRRKK